MSGQSSNSAPRADRFEASKFTLIFDNFMSRFIKFGGLTVILAVAGIFVFILAQILPLFKSARLTEMTSYKVPAGSYAVLGVDEWTELPMLVSTDGTITFVDLTDDAKTSTADIDLKLSSPVSSVFYRQQNQMLAMGTEGGQVVLAEMNYKADFSGDERRIVSKPKRIGSYQVGEEGNPIRQVAYGDAGKNKMIGVIQEVDGKLTVHVLTLVQKMIMGMAGKTKLDNDFDITARLGAAPHKVLIGGAAESLVVSTENGEIIYFRLDDDELVEVQRFRPFETHAAAVPASIDLMFGGVSLVLTSEAGDNEIYSLSVNPVSGQREYGKIKTFPKLPGGADVYAGSLRNKAFLVADGSHLSLRYGTTGSIRSKMELPFVVTKAVIASKFNRILLLDDANTLHVYELDDHHPEAGFAAYFQKLWYEGLSAPEYSWQSTGGTDDVETKLSMVPLIIGTLKGTFYAMLFAVPIALLAALYCSQFQHPMFKMVVKPTMEIMASLPSVVLGFLAALWLAPLIETRVPSLMLILILVPLGAMLFGMFWSRLPRKARVICPDGWEFIGFAPILIGIVLVGWHMGPVIERALFVVQDPETGAKIADFRLWLPAATGLSFEQRNAVVVGFAMGFAVIPIIFTITEDALSNVPKALTSASLALGATRWQTATRVVLPTASAGIFSACMIGLGRAVGETMIVLMATGNTAVLDMNIFNGMRTLSANIAVELPEAPHEGTLYRTLFLGAFLLFMMTFVVNTLAEVLRQHLRTKYKTV